MNKTEEERRKKKTKKWYISYIVLKMLTIKKFDLEKSGVTSLVK